jgi:hypothetical protein
VCVVDTSARASSQITSQISAVGANTHTANSLSSVHLQPPSLSPF